MEEEEEGIIMKNVCILVSEWLFQYFCCSWTCGKAQARPPLVVALETQNPNHKLEKTHSPPPTGFGSNHRASN